MPKITSIVESNIFKYRVHMWTGDIITTKREFHISLEENWCTCLNIYCYDCPKLCEKPSIIEYLGETHPNLKITNPELFI